MRELTETPYLWNGRSCVLAEHSASKISGRSVTPHQIIVSSTFRNFQARSRRRQYSIVCLWFIVVVVQSFEVVVLERNTLK